MDREQLKGKQTPGKWIVIASWNDYVITVDGLENDVIVWQDGAYDTPTMTEADATLAAEAGNVANRTGMWPEDLVARVKELEERYNVRVAGLKEYRDQLEQRVKELEHVLEVAMKSLATYGRHPIIESMANSVLNKKP